MPDIRNIFPYCVREVTVPEEWQGRRFKCPVCGNTWSPTASLPYHLSVRPRFIADLLAEPFGNPRPTTAPCCPA